MTTNEKTTAGAAAESKCECANPSLHDAHCAFLRARAPYGRCSRCREALTLPPALPGVGPSYCGRCWEEQAGRRPASKEVTHGAAGERPELGEGKEAERATTGDLDSECLAQLPTEGQGVDAASNADVRGDGRVERDSRERPASSAIGARSAVEIDEYVQSRAIELVDIVRARRTRESAIRAAALLIDGGFVRRPEERRATPAQRARAARSDEARPTAEQWVETWMATMHSPVTSDLPKHGGMRAWLAHAYEAGRASTHLPEPVSPADVTRKLARYIVETAHRMLGRVVDHACAQCVPGGEIVVPGFRCALHLAEQVLATPPRPEVEAPSEALRLDGGDAGERVAWPVGEAAQRASEARSDEAQAPFATINERGLAQLEAELHEEPWTSRKLAVLTLVQEVRHLRAQRPATAGGAPAAGTSAAASPEGHRGCRPGFYSAGCKACLREWQAEKAARRANALPEEEP